MKSRFAPARRRRRLGAALGLFALYSLLGFFILPLWLRPQLEQRLAAATGRTVSVAKVRFNPWTLSVTVEGLDIRTREGAGSFVGWTSLKVNFGALASLGGDWVLEEVALDGFHAAVIVESDGTFNFTDILDRLGAEPTNGAAAGAAASRAVRVGLLGVKDSRLDFTDRSRSEPFATTLGPLNFTVSGFRTVTREGAPYHFAAVTEAGERLEWSGTIETRPFRSEGELTLEQVLLPKYSAYYADRIGAELASGRLSIRAHYTANLSPDERVLRLRDGRLQLRDVQLLERSGGKELLALPSLDVSGATVDAQTMAARVGSIRASGGKIAVRRDAKGGLNWLAVLPPPAAPSASGSTTSASGAAAVSSGSPDVRIGEFALEDFQMTVEDLALPRPAQLTLTRFGFSLRDFSLADGAVIPIQAAFDWAPQGRVVVSGTVTLRPEPIAEMKADLTQFDLRPISPYIEQHLNARLTQGTVAASQTLRYRHMGPENPAEASYEGSVWIDQLGIVDGVRQEELAGFAGLQLNGVKASLASGSELQIQEIVLSETYLRVEVRDDRTLNIGELVRSSEPVADAAAPTSASTSGPAPKITIGGVKIDGGGFNFTDRSIDPQVRVSLEKFGGTIGALSSERPTRAEVDLHGVVDGVGPVAVTGLVDPLGAPRLIDLQIGVRNVDLLPLSPYSGKYAGYELARGKLDLDLRTHVEGTQLRAENVLTLHQFTFGAPVSSPDATALPVRLGVALLKDLDGRIVIDVPMSGDLADPDLRLGRVIGRVIVNLLTKAAVSPFALLGSMFGGSGEELAFQEFEPGSDELRDAARAKLETMVQALRNRPALNLGIEGSSDGPADSFALQHSRLAALVRGRIWESRRAANPDLPPPGQLVIPPEEHAAMVKQLLDAQFPPGTEFGTPLPAAPDVVAPPPAPSGFLTNLVRALTFAAARERRAIEQENAARAAEHAAAVAEATTAGLPLEEMTGRLAATMEITPDDLLALAAARAARVRDYVVTTGGIAAERLFLLQPATGAAANRGPRVFLTLQ